MRLLTYNQLAGGSLERLATLSDGVFAIAMTLLVLDLKLPTTQAIHREAELWQALVNLAPRLVAYFMSFLTLGIFWIGQQTQLNHKARCNRALAWLHLVFLLAVGRADEAREMVERANAISPGWATYLLRFTDAGVVPIPRAPVEALVAGLTL